MPALIAAAAAALALAACGGDDTGDSADAPLSAEVAIADFAYEPDPATLKAGGTVTWSNGDDAAHTASSDEGTPVDFDTGTLELDDSKDVKLDAPGTYAYHCDFHATMTATVEVVE